MIIGTGIDIVDTHRIRRSLSGYGERFSDRVFTKNEQACCSAIKNEPVLLAEYFAAKEAMVKALGTGFSGGITLKDVEVVNSFDGRPGVRLHGKALQVAAELGVKGIFLSLSHGASLAAAFVVLEG